jgi:hypothetical protein
MQFQAPLWIRVICNVTRAFLALVSLLVAFVAGAVIVVPLAIFVWPLVAILGGLLVVYVFAATASMADDWQAARMRRGGGSAERERLAPAPVPRSAPAARVGG